MNVWISFKIIDSAYDQSYANEYSASNESYGNYKYQSVKSFLIKSVKEVIAKYGDLPYTFKLVNGESIPHVFPEMEIFECIREHEVHCFAVAKKVLKSTYSSTRGQRKYITFYISDEFNVIDIAPYIYIDSADFPESLSEKIKQLLERERNQ